MKARLEYINPREVLGYLGYNGAEIDEATQGRLDKAINKVMESATPRLNYSVYNLENGCVLVNTGYSLVGQDIKELLASSDKAVVFVATIGAVFEQELRKAQLTDMAYGVILDACGSAAIENICDNFCRDMADELIKSGSYLTDRFSPGYGDMPLIEQINICRLLDSQRRVGVSLTSGGLMVPTKTVTAIMGIAKKPQTMRKRGCENCNLFNSCDKRKRGNTCD